jgi:hypothetical protein
MQKQKYIKYLKKNIFGGELDESKVCEDNHINSFTEIQTDGGQNCGIYEKDEELIKCENRNEGQFINKANFIAITNKLIEIKNTNKKGLLPIIHSYCIKEINGITNYYTKMQKLDGDITDLLFKKLPELIINTKYIEYKQEFNIIINNILNPILQTPQEQQSMPTTPSAPFHNFTPARRPIFDDSDSDTDFTPVRQALFGGSKIQIEFNNFIQDFNNHYDIHLKQINKKVINIIRTLYDNYLIDNDGYIPQNYGYMLVGEKLEDDFKYGYSVEGELNLNVLLYKIDFMSLEIITTKQEKNFDNFKFNFLNNNKHNFLSKYNDMTEMQRKLIF